jgi:bacteriocin biosynthesis cyclodehydratase domain-containing protein
MVAMVLRLDPAFPVVWRSPFSLQVGLDPVIVRLDDVTTADERLLAALVTGVTRPGLDMLARTAGAEGVDALLAALSPALASPTPAPTATVLVVGDGPTATAIVAILAESGVRVVIAADAAAAEHAECDLAVAVGHFVLSPELRGLWLRRDLPHLPVTYTDTAAHVGPLVVPGETACLYCVDRHRRDVDPAWPAIAAQLWGRRSAAESAVTARQAAAVAARAVLAHLAGGGSAGGAAGAVASVRVDAATGELSSRRWAVHPECGCSVPGGNGSPGGSPRDRSTPRLPRTVRAVAARA